MDADHLDRFASSSEELKSSRRRRSYAYSRSRRTKLIYGLSVALIVACILLLILGVKLSLYAREINALTAIEQKQARELAALKPELEKVKAEIADLVESRLPYLNKLEFDKVIPINEEYVKNIVFTLVGNGDTKSYEYKLVMRNQELTAIHPQVKIIFFNRVGIQIGESDIGVHEDGVPTLEVLERGEVRSYASAIELAEELKPEYFWIRAAKPVYSP